MRRETRSEIRARIKELRKLQGELSAEEGRVEDLIEARISLLKSQLESATEDLFKSVVKSHEVICAVKDMDAKAAYGQDPGMYYTLAVCGEAGEMANKIVKALRNGNDPGAIREAVISELPDVIIYGAVLAHVMDLNLSKLVNAKVGVVIERAQSGYYGPPLPSAAARASSEAGPGSARKGRRGKGHN